MTFGARERGEEGQRSVRTDHVDVRRMRLTKPMFERSGYTDGCPGCQRLRAGMEDRRGHTEPCRKRIMEAMSQTVEGRAELE